MFGISNNKVLEQQTKAAEKESLDILTDNELSPLSRANALRQCLQLKEKAARFILEELEGIITRFANNGVSSVSLFGIAEAYQKALESATAQMQVFANELAKLTRNEDMEEGYTFISERLSSEAETLINPLKEKKEKAVSDLDSMIFLEIYDTWNNLENKPI